MPSAELPRQGLSTEAETRVSFENQFLVFFRKLSRGSNFFVALLVPDQLTFMTLLFNTNHVGRVPFRGRRQNVRCDLMCICLLGVCFQLVASNPLTSPRGVALLSRSNADRILVQLWEHFA